MQGNNLPDIALFPQPGVMMDIANKAGRWRTWSALLDKTKIESTPVPGELGCGTPADGKLVAACP